MDKFLRYRGEFLSHAGVVWRVEILQEAEQALPAVGSLTFEAEEALLMEWEEKSKEEVIQGCMATVKLESPGDRTYEDLYTIEVGRIRMDVYRDAALYWSGLLDAEFYEEPYERAANYPVSLKFSDFGVLSRLKYDLAGMRSVREIIAYSLQRAGLNTELDTSLVSLCAAGGTTPLDLSDIKVRSDNFYDEDGEALTLEEVLEGILQPLALRIVQRKGKVYVYDLNGLHGKGKQAPVVWDGASQTMGVDKVYNNVKITWSTYAQSGNLLPEKCWGDTETDASLNALNLPGGKSKDGATYYSYHYSTDLADWFDTTDCGFTLWTSREGKNAEILDDDIRFFRTVPQYDGDESEGIALFWKSVWANAGDPAYKRGAFRFRPYGKWEDGMFGDKAGHVLFRSEKAWLPPVDDEERLLVRVGIDMLFDPRFNPFEQAADMGEGYDQKSLYDTYNRYGNFVYVPVTVKFQPDGSDDVYGWDNRDMVTHASLPIKKLPYTYGSWSKLSGDDGGAGAWGYLSWYDAKDRYNTSGVLGWKKNRPAINPHDEKLQSGLENAEDGQYIPYPNFGGRGGKLWVEVRYGAWYVTNEDWEWDSGGKMPEPIVAICGASSWILMKLPEIEVVNKVQFDQTIDTDDVEYSAEINPGAKESLEIDTICGTSKAGVPMARGAYFSGSTGKQVRELARAGRTAQAEDLLTGTLYSQFAGRHTRLEGEARITADGMSAYTEQNQAGKLFLLAGDVQDAIADTSQVILIELSPDEYVKEGEE